MKTKIVSIILIAIFCTAVMVKGQIPLHQNPGRTDNIPYGKKLPPPPSFNAREKNVQPGMRYAKFDSVTRQVKWFMPGVQHNENEMPGFMYQNGKPFTMNSNSSESLASNFHLTKDINTLKESNPSNYVENNIPPSFAVLNNVTYFAADDGVHGTELWGSDGTPAGTYLVKDINPGPHSSNISRIVAANGKLYLSASTDAEGQEPWISDGGEAGTQLLLDINTNPTYGSNPYEFVNVNGTVFFVTDGLNTQSEIWKTDGTTVGTVPVKDLWYTESADGVFSATAVNGILFFTTYYSFAYGTELWRSDGTDAGTYLVKDINPYGDSGPDQLTAFNNKLYFSADDGTGRKLWVSDGTSSGTTYAPGNNDVLLQGYSYGFFNDPPFTVINNTMYFWGYTAVTGWELFKYNPSIVASIELVKNISPGTESTGYDYYEMRNVNDTLYFRVINSTDGSNELWMSKGKAFNTQKVKTFSPGESFYNLFDGYGTLYFVKYDAAYGYELWKSDGTNAGTVMVKDIYTGPVGSGPGNLTDCNGKIFFAAAKANKGRELWITNGSGAGTAQIKDINKTTTSSSYAGNGTNYYNIAALNDGVVFSAFEPLHGYEVYRSDGTAGGTALVDDVFSGATSSGPHSFLAKNNAVYFTIYTPGLAIYKTNGTAGSTKKITDINSLNSYLYKYDVADNGLVFYVLYNFSTSLYELWRSDGTTAGTFLLNSNLYYYNYLATAGNKAFFVAGDDIHGYELWKSNGTVSGTKMVKDIYPGVDGSFPYSLFAYNNEIYFGALDPSTYNNALWKSDGTDAGTIKLKEIQPFNTYSYYTGYFCVSNNTLFFFATDYNNSVYSGELWKTNGTAAGTKLVKNTYPPYGSYSMNSLTDVNGVLFFTADDGVHGVELWKSNGFPAGTKMVKDITPDYSSDLSYLCSAGGKLYFAKDVYYNTETLWSSDGTESGTNAVTDAGLTDLSNMINLIGVGNKLFFSAYSYHYGSELWVGEAGGSSFAAAPIADNEAIKANTAAFNAVLYPNPVHKNTSLQISGDTKNINITITDISGRTLWQGKYSGQALINISTETLAKGVYMLIVKNNKDIRTIKFIKE